MYLGQILRKYQVAEIALAYLPLLMNPGDGQ